MVALGKLPALTTERLVLALVDERSADAVADYFTRNREFMRPWNPSSPEDFFTPEWQAERLKFDLEEYYAGRMARFWLFARDDAARARVIGHIAISNIIRGALQGCHVGYMVDEAEGGRGLIVEGGQAVIRYAFGELQLHRIEANIMPHNHRSIRVAEKLGFAREGYSPEYLRIKGVWEGHYRYGLVSKS